MLVRTASMISRTRLSSILFKTPFLPLARKDGYNIQRRWVHASSLNNSVFTTDSAQRVIASTSCIQEIDAQLDRRILKVLWKDGATSRFPYVFLRENCKCPECFEASSKQRAIDTVRDVKLNIRTKHAEISKCGEYLKCLWPDGHQSVYSASWLYDRRIPEEEERELKRRNADSIVKDEIILWDNKDMQDKIPTYEYEAIMNDDRSLFDYLYTLYQRGLVLVDNAPNRDDVMLDIAARVGYPKPSHYGNTLQVLNKKDPSNLAYTSGRLPFHVDQPYLSLPPDIQGLHCVELSSDISGGDNLFVDGFNVAKKLMENNYEAFETLCRIDVPFIDLGTDIFGEFYVGHSQRTIELNQNGRLYRILYNNHVRMDAFRDCTPEEILKFYNAYYHFNQIMQQPENCIQLRLKPGQIAFFHNTRVLHSRTTFDVMRSSSSDTRRYLVGIYYDWDVIFSKLRVLRDKFSLETPTVHQQTNDFF